MCVRLFLILLIFQVASLSLLAQTTDFTYQGQLQNQAVVANGVFDFEFALFGASLGGAQLGPTLTRGGVNVANGVFSVSLDFGAQFDGTARFLEIRVRQSGGGSFTTLAPRQNISSSPYAVRSLDAQNAVTSQNATNAFNATNAANLTGPLAGDVTGTQNSTTVARLRGTNVAATAPTNGQVLKFNSAKGQWQPDTDNTGSGGGGGTITGVTAGTGLTGGGTTGTVTVGIAPGGVGLQELASNSVGTAQIFDNSVTNAKVASAAVSTTKIVDGAVTGLKIADGVITEPKIGAGQVVKSINTLRDNVTLAAGSNVTITPSGNTLTIASSGSTVNAILNQTTQQAGANFNISGTGSASVFDSGTHYSIDGLRVLGTPGLNTIVAGTSAGAVNTGGGNAFFGFSAGAANTTGDSNAFFGSRAGEDNINGIQNAFFGTSAGVSNTSGSANAFFGQIAGAGNTTGQGNSFFGGAAGASTTTAFNNSFFGREAGRNNTTGETNAAIGYRAGFSLSSGSNNVFIGTEAGFANTVGTDNTAIGRNANFQAVNLTNATAIGARALAAANNSLVLGSISGVNGATDDTNVGIGTSVPSRRLFIRGLGSDGSGNGDLYVQGTGTTGAAVTLEAVGLSGGRTYSWISTGTGASSGPARLAAFDVTAGAYRMVIDGQGRMGIGTTSPDNLLSVNGTANKPGGGSWAVFSDERLKNIKGRFTSGLKELLQLEPIRYEYKPDNAHGIESEDEHIGFSAQAVQKVIPEAVTSTETGYLMINNDPILWTMLNAVKEQQEQIVAEKAENAKLKAEVKALKAVVCLLSPAADICRSKK